MDDNVRKLCPCHLCEFLGIQADGCADPTAADIDLIKIFRTVVDEGREKFLHSQRAAAAPDITGDFCDLFYRDQLHGFFSGYFGSLF